MYPRALDSAKNLVGYQGQPLRKPNKVALDSNKFLSLQKLVSHITLNVATL